MSSASSTLVGRDMIVFCNLLGSFDNSTGLGCNFIFL
jgi:hypothetical protein